MDSHTVTHDPPTLDPTRLCPECNVPLYVVNISVNSYAERTMWLCLTCPYCTCD
jgi:hypothetical protein